MKGGLFGGGGCEHKEQRKSNIKNLNRLRGRIK